MRRRLSPTSCHSAERRGHADVPGPVFATANAQKVEGSSQWRAGDWDGIGGVLQDCGNPRSRASERERVGLSKTAAAQS